MAAEASLPSVVHALTTLGRDYGGPTTCVPALCEALAALGVPVRIVVPDTGAAWGPQVSVGVPVRSVPAVVSRRLRPIWSPGFGGAVEEEIDKSAAALVHVHESWLPSVHRACAVARARGLPYVVTPHGTLAPWAFDRRRWKKRLAWHVYQRRDVDGAALLHATAQAEADALRALGFRHPIAVIPNGVALPPARPAKSRAPRTAHAPRTALFLSRLHPKKGLVDLVRAWARVRPDGWALAIVGPDEDGHQAEVERAIAAERLGASVSIAPRVDGDAKWDLYARADLFVLPTRYENFGLVVAEALASGLPVITTEGAPWRELVDERCGWWIPVGVEPLAEALRAATALDDEARWAMGERGRALVACRYGLDAIARAMGDVYAWLVGGGPAPAVVQR